MSVSATIQKGSKFWGVVCVLQLGLLAIALSVKFWKWDFDDGFIVYRYVENLLLGKGWVYNPGEIYNASTSVLNTGFIALVSLLGFSPSAAAHLLGGSSLFLLGVSVYFIFRRDASCWFSVAVASLAMFLMANNFTWGLESHLFYGLFALIVCLEIYEITSWFLLGILILVRPDAIILLLMRIGVSIWQGRVPFVGALIAIAVVLPWAIFSLFTFGNVFPATLAQKIWQGQSGYWGSGWIFVKGLFNYIRGDAFTHILGLHWAPIVLSAPLMLVPQGVLFCLSRQRKVIFLAAYVLSILIAYSVLNVPNYHWYYVGFLFVVIVFAAYGVLFVSQQSRFRLPWMLDRALVLILLVTTILILRGIKSDFFDVRTDVYRQLSEKIVEQSVADGSIAAVEVGVVGYYSKRPMVDLVGLTTPYGEFITGKNNLLLLNQIKPEVVIMHEPLMPHEMALYGDSLFVERYRQQDFVAFPGYSELAFFVRQQREKSKSLSRLQLVQRHDMRELRPQEFRIARGDPWLEYELAQPMHGKGAVLHVTYQLGGARYHTDSVMLGRVYVASQGQGYAEEHAYPITLRGGGEQQGVFFLTPSGTEQNKEVVISRIRFDPLQDMRLWDDATIEIKSISVGFLQ